MKANEAVIEWTPAHGRRDETRGRVIVRPRGRGTGDFALSGGAAYSERATLQGDASTAAVFIDFNTLVLRDGLDPKVVHEAFKAIDEYREAVAPDIE